MKTLHGSGISTNIIDNNEVNTNATVQTKRMHKTKDNRKNKKKWEVSVLKNVTSRSYSKKLAEKLAGSWKSNGNLKS